MATWPADVAFNTHEAAASAKKPQALRAMQTAAVAMAHTAIDLVTDRAALERVTAGSR